MGRRKRRIIKTFKKTLPKVYTCPKCGMTAIRVFIEDNLIKISCGSCDIRHHYESNKKKESIDIYNEFIDKFMAGKI
jgi:transcription elongation factor Elf1